MATRHPPRTRMGPRRTRRAPHTLIRLTGCRTAGPRSRTSRATASPRRHIGGTGATLLDGLRISRRGLLRPWGGAGRLGGTVGIIVVPLPAGVGVQSLITVEFIFFLVCSIE